MIAVNFPAVGGTYALIFAVSEPLTLRAGALGDIRLEAPPRLSAFSDQPSVSDETDSSVLSPRFNGGRDQQQRGVTKSPQSNDNEAWSLIYIGSAFGPGGLRARINRHLRPEKKVRWHVDYLTTAVPVSAVWLDTSGERLECRWAGIFRELAVIEEPIRGFGASDCACPTHLFALPQALLSRVHAALGSPREIETGAQ